MDLILNYNSEESFVAEQESEELLLQPRQVRSVYLVTYSQANLTIFPTRENFATCMAELFITGKVKVQQWVCCIENHENTGGHHFHLAVKLSGNKRWLPVKHAFEEKYGVVLNFSAGHTNYYNTWKYVTKSDKEYVQSIGHPDLTSSISPRTSGASRKRQQNTETSKNKKKPKRLTNFMVSNIIVNKNITSKTELYALADKQKNEGKTDLYSYIINRNSKKISEIINTTWDIHNANSQVERQQQSRLEIMGECLENECSNDCAGKWYQAATQTLRNNNIVVREFANSITLLLEKGRGKFRNIFICGPANCGKTFLLKPLCLIYDAFQNPASGSFNWVGVDTKEIIFLNDFRWSTKIIQWHDLLLLLEGEPVHLPAPKTYYEKDICLTRDTPIFATSSEEIKFIKHGILSDRETGMMSVRWKVYNFTHQISEDQQKELAPCMRCFAELLLHAENII